MSAPEATTSPQMSGPKTKPIERTPFDWWRAKGSKWPLVCLAATMSGWDPRCEDGTMITEAGYDDALACANALVEQCRAEAGKAQDSTAGRRVFVLVHSSDMQAIVVVKPGLADAQALLLSVRGGELAAEQRTQAVATDLWSRCLWPKGDARQALQDEYPLAYIDAYPNAYFRSLGVDGVDVRKRQ
jgi:hypothetical protein